MSKTIQEKLSHLIEQRAWEQLSGTLDQMSSADRRRTQTIVRTDILPELDNETFWEAYLHLIIYRPQAFLASIVALQTLAQKGELRFDTPAAQKLADVLTDKQRQKVLNMVIPVLCTEQQICELFHLLKADNERDRLAALIRFTSPEAYYVLLRTLLHAQHGHDLALQCGRYILRKEDELSLNMGAILKTVFALSELSLHHSLRLEPYELNRIENSFEHFRYVLEGKKPNIQKTL